MKYLIEWGLKALLICTIGSVASITLQLLALAMWDSRFMDMAENVTKYIWNKKT